MRQARHRFEHGDRVVRVGEQRAELAGVDQAGDVAGAVHLGGTRGRIRSSTAGAMELPPESLFCEPISVSSWPSAPTLLMPYIGLCGLLPVSFSERAAIGKPLTLARVATWVDACMPRRMAPSECHGRTELLVDEVVGRAGRVGRVRRHVAGQAELGVALRRQEVGRVAAHGRAGSRSPAGSRRRRGRSR